MHELKLLFNAYQAATKRADIADVIYSGDPEDIEKEKAFDKAYAEQHAAGVALAEYISKYANIDIKTAHQMVRQQQDQLAALVKRIA